MSSNATGKVNIWQANHMSALDKCTSSTQGNGMQVSKTYDPMGYINRITTISKSNATMDYIYSWDEGTGNLMGRANTLYPATNETFGYDVMDRLQNIYPNGSNTPLGITYDAGSGNILSKYNAGTKYDYTGIQPHAVTAIENPTDKISINPISITNNAFKKVSKILQSTPTGSNELDYNYGTDYSRKLAVLKVNDQIVSTKYYQNAYEVSFDAQNNTRELNYIYSGDGLCGIFVKNNKEGTEKDTMYYINTDHLGSIVLVSDVKGKTLQEIGYDAWGNRRNGQTWEDLTASSSHFIFDRGFTGHEHVPVFNLINMNARMYDPIVGRMLAADDDIQDPENTQSFNRYSYCLNNPLKYIDPTGNEEEDDYRDGEGNGARGGFDIGRMHNEQQAAEEEEIRKKKDEENARNFFLWDHLDNLAQAQKMEKNPVGQNQFNLVHGTSSPVVNRPNTAQGSGGNYLRYDASYVNANRTQGTLTWFDGSGNQVAQYKATSGSGNPAYKTIPEGTWDATNYRTRSEDKFTRHGIGFTVNLGPDRDGRSAIRIHPARSMGTEGCIGLFGNVDEILDFQSRISTYLTLYPSIPVIVTYPKP